MTGKVECLKYFLTPDFRNTTTMCCEANRTAECKDQTSELLKFTSQILQSASTNYTDFLYECFEIFRNSKKLFIISVSYYLNCWKAMVSWKKFQTILSNTRRRVWTNASVKVKGIKQCLNYGTISNLEPIHQVCKTWCITGKQITFERHILKNFPWTITNCTWGLKSASCVCLSAVSWTLPLKMEKLQNSWIMF